MAKVVLLRPTYIVEGRSEEGIDNHMYLGVLCLGAALRKAGYEVVLIDFQVQADWRDRLGKECRDALYVGISAMSSQIYSGVEAAKIVRETRPEVPIVWGGVHASILPEQTMRSEWCDVAAIGEADETAVELARAYESGRAIDDIGGIAFLRDGRMVMNPKKEIVQDLDTLPMPAYDLYTDEEMEKFIVPSRPDPAAGWMRTMILHSGRGCLFQCTFCINTVLPETNRKHRMKSAARLIEEMEYLGKRYRAEFFVFQDEDFFTRRERVVEFLDLYEKKGLKFHWGTNCRANYFNDKYIDEAFWKRLHRCGATYIGVGVESGSSRMLKKIRKGITPDMVRRTARTAASADLHLICSFIVAMPGEERADIIETLKIIWDIAHIKKKHRYIIGPAVYRPYPGSKMFDEAVEIGLKAPQSLDEWAELALTKWGYLKEEDMPWIRDRDLIFYITELMSFLLVEKTVSRFYYVKLLLRAFFKPITYFRIRTGFWSGLFEIQLFKLIRSFAR